MRELTEEEEKKIADDAATEQSRPVSQEKAPSSKAAKPGAG